MGKQLLNKPPAVLNTKYLLTLPAFKEFYGKSEAAVAWCEAQCVPSGCG